jgi:cardiolipin synthase
MIAPRSFLTPLFAFLAVAGFSGCGTLMEKNQVRQPVEHLYPVRDPQFRRSMEALLGPSLVGGNRTQTLLNGDQIFPAMLAAIQGAKKTVHFETYIYWKGQAGSQFAEALAARARAGVKVRVILDWQGSRKIGREADRLMRDTGVEIVRYHPLGWYDPRRVNNRTHRKLLIIDGKTGFIGGVGIADVWLGNAESPDHWRDTHYRVEGPVVAQLQASFMDNWMKTRGEVLHGDAVLPPLTAMGGERAQAFRSSPGLGSPVMRSMYLLSLAAASRSILIESPYFVPDDLFTRELVAARQRGVQVQILVPGPHIDAKVTRRASRSRWRKLLEAGVEFYEYQPTMIHCKLLIVDDLWTSVGSSNLDNRSLRLNDEANLNVLDRGFAARQRAIFEQDKARSKRVSLEEWKHRSLYEKVTTPFREAFAPEL